jgi:hypothetical protein
LRLENYRTPSLLVKKGIPNRIGRVFLDRDEVRAGDTLDTALLDGISRARALIVLCSAAPKDRPWINEEIRVFREKHSGRPILPPAAGLDSAELQRSLAISLNRLSRLQLELRGCDRVRFAR